MADESPPSVSPGRALGAPTSHFYPFATSPDVIRSHEKDVFMTGSLVQQAQGIIRSLRGARFAHTHAESIKHLTEILYFSLTTAIGNRTLGEEYCDLVQLEDDTLRLPSITRRVGYILSSILVPWTLQRFLPKLRQRLRAKLERSIARQQIRSAQQKSSPTTPQPLFSKLRIQQYILEHLDSITSLSPIYALSIATFYFTGSYYHLSKRLWNLRYVFTKKIEDEEQRVGYEVLGVLLVLQIAVQGFLHVRKLASSVGEDQSTTADAAESRSEAGALVKSIQNPVSMPLLPASTPNYDLAEDPGAVSWIPDGQQRKCTLCLEAFKDPSVTTCGHVFCWVCVRDWVREKPESLWLRKGQQPVFSTTANNFRVTAVAASNSTSTGSAASSTSSAAAIKIAAGGNYYLVGALALVGTAVATI
ncbi:peroxisomal integral membrane protein Pex10-Penicillium chrysogenum [Penicillium riverlandense]|uniref:peroxisomal integral membrane protein Pex10-Penicillium chrysogenum n=1 Tax=Penicillium riverlandense TaxID=1903569 RepID=UPI002548D24A|nr:peroxisomal integral membrane protein Pex10-Penicillium chrysogenum [Penicillium riverlandense]KAJ5825966.1 peroxisomal integral membrane protein Pex10-Penicillium chrysogenum [Penicillium riverlandense]